MKVSAQSLYNLILNEHDHLFMILDYLQDKPKIISTFESAFSRPRKDEETLMLSVKYDQSDYFEHRIEHRNILNDIFSMDPDKFESSDEMKLFIKRIIDSHIDQFDSKLFKFCERQFETLLSRQATVTD